ncbi:MAG: SAM-dependent methyltransferase, partial [Chloroflexi bacterium]|nr:SAM-dependent methyltransferase [Chloroflexota bacterium]
HVEVRGLGKIQTRKVEIPPLDAVVGNPPYVRQEDIPRTKNGGKNGAGTKDYYMKLVKEESDAKFSGRSDLHLYFWPHSATFLKDDGHLCLLTSSQWLDVEYGFRLQEWILNNFSIVAIFESIDEPWFVGARVATTVTILRRQRDETARMENVVRFVQLRRPVSEILSHDGTSAGAVRAADQFRDEILGLTANTANERYRARIIRQGKLWEDGIKLSATMSRARDSGEGDEEDEDSNSTEFPVQAGKYYGGKWGLYLRAPDLWFELLDSYGERFAPLGDVAIIRRGITSGNDKFFFPIDCSGECLEAHKDPVDFKDTYGFPRKAVESGTVKLVRCGEGRGEIKPIESKYLEPEVHSLMEIDGFTVSPENCSRLILLAGEPKSRLRGTHVLKYIQWGEKQGFHTGSTCAARVTEEREWYDLTGHERAPVLWPKERQYRHIAAANENQLVANCRMYEIYPPEDSHDPSLWGGMLNSTWVLLSSFQFGRPVGNEGNWSTMVVDVNMMLVPDPTKATPQARERVARAFGKLKERKALMFLSERRLREMAYTSSGKQYELEALSNQSELDMPDRRELDDAVLEMMGVDSPEERERLIQELYAYLGEFFELTRQKEEKAIANKNTAKRRGPARPGDIAAQIYKEIAQKDPALLSDYESAFLDKSKPFDTYDLPAEGEAEKYGDMLMAHGVRFVKGKKTRIIETKTRAQADLLALVANSGKRGLVRAPHEEAECLRILREYEVFLKKREERIQELIQERTADEDLQGKIREALMPLLIGD